MEHDDEQDIDETSFVVDDALSVIVSVGKVSLQTAPPPESSRRR